MRLQDRVRLWLEGKQAKEVPSSANHTSEIKPVGAPVNPPPVPQTPAKEQEKVTSSFIGWEGVSMPYYQTCGPRPPINFIPMEKPIVSTVNSKEESKMAKDDEDQVFEEDEEQEEDDESEEGDSEEDSEEEDSEEDSDGEGEDEEDEKSPAEKKALKADGSPEKFFVRKLIKKNQLRNDGSVYRKPVLVNVGEYEGYIPKEKDIEANETPLYGGGDYMVINASSKKLIRKYTFPGEERDPAQDDASSGPASSQTPLGSSVSVSRTAPGQPLSADSSPGPLTSIDRVAMAMASGQSAAVEQLAKLAEKFAETGDTEQLSIVMNSLKEIATGKKETTAQDKLLEMMMADRNMLMESMLKGRGKESSSSEIVRETIGTMKDMFSMARDMLPGDDTSVQMVKEVGGMVQSSLKEVTDTLVTVTGSKGDLSGPLPPPPEPVYRCERCKNIVQPVWKVCPNCGLVFKPGLRAVPEPPPATEVFEGAPPIPKEVKDKIGYLRRLAVMIKQNHDPVAKGVALFRFADPEEKLLLLFTAEFGYDNLMRLAKPYKNSSEIPEGEAIFSIIDSANGKLWISRLFKSVRETAKEDGVSLAPPVRQKFLDQLNAYSPVKFLVKPGAKTTMPGEKKLLKQEKVEQVSEKVPPEAPEAAQGPTEPKGRPRTPPMTTCPVCDAPMPVSELKDHLFSVHPRQPKVAPAPVVTKQAPAPLSTLTEESSWDGTEDNG